MSEHSSENKLTTSLKKSVTKLMSEYSYTDIISLNTKLILKEVEKRMLTTIFFKLIHYGNVEDIKSFLDKNTFEKYMIQTSTYFIADLYTDYAKNNQIDKLKNLEEMIQYLFDQGHLDQYKCYLEKMSVKDRGNRAHRERTHLFHVYIDESIKKRKEYLNKIKNIIDKLTLPEISLMVMEYLYKFKE